MPLPFEGVRERLLRAGAAPRSAQRYVTELREHLADLTEQERSAGMDLDEAAARARLLLGGEEYLAQSMLDKGIPRSLPVKAPFAVLVASPVVLLLASHHRHRYRNDASSVAAARCGGFGHSGSSRRIHCAHEFRYQ
jgi:hypothetical protein